MRFKYPIYILLYFIISLPIFVLTYEFTGKNISIHMIYVAISILACCFIIYRFSKKINYRNKLEKSMLYNVLDNIGAMIVVWSHDFSSVKSNSCFLDKTCFNPETL